MIRHIKESYMPQPRTKIVATLGPACWDEPVLRDLLAAGVNVVRINFSHADHASTAEKIALIRRLAQDLDLNVAILADLQGPRIRVGALPAEGIALVENSAVSLSTRGAPGSIPVDYAGLADDVEPGDLILLNDGLLGLRVTAVDRGAGRINATVIAGGLLTSHKGINVPARALGVPTVTEKDRDDLAFALQHGVDMVALSFVRTGADVAGARALIRRHTERKVPLIAKIEKGAAVDNFADILAEADGIMVARGDMGVELPTETLPGIQKRLIAQANAAGKPVVTATQMLDSMIRNPRPTRAEATDVANAVLDGTDALMLSGETAAGKYPLASVLTMTKIALEAEKLLDYGGWAERLAKIEEPRPVVQASDTAAVTEVICRSADSMADELNARAIIAITRTGTTARLVAKYRPAAALIAVTDDAATQRTLAITWGVQALLADHFHDDTLVTLSEAERIALDHGLISEGDLLVFAGGLPLPQPGKTSLLKVQVAGEPPVQ
jgi:pyruvate kinase